MSRAADSAGVPWSGRNLTSQPFMGDDGSTDPALAEALAGGDLTSIVAAWATSRVLAPIVAVLGEGDELVAAEGDKSADMALITIHAADGRKLLPAFSSTVALTHWSSTARPVPVEAARAAQAAVVEECDAIVIDPGGAGVVLPRPVVYAVAQGRDWLPPARDPELLAGVAALVTAVPGIKAHRCEPDGVTGLLVVLGLPPGLDADQVTGITTRLSDLLARDEVVAERTTSLRLSLRTA
jgi:hypothetical protein